MTGSAQIVVNGVAHELALEPDRSLLYALREEFGLTGAKPGCGEGACGACTVLLDGEPVRACRARIADAAGHAVTSVEGLASDGRLHPVQRAFVEVGAFQCGYCTAGMIMSTVALLERTPIPTTPRSGRPWRATSAAAARTPGSCAPCAARPSWRGTRTAGPGPSRSRRAPAC